MGLPVTSDAQNRRGISVSYTHLDVYKRQVVCLAGPLRDLTLTGLRIVIKFTGRGMLKRQMYDLIARLYLSGQTLFIQLRPLPGVDIDKYTLDNLLSVTVQKDLRAADDPAWGSILLKQSILKIGFITGLMQRIDLF